MHKEIINFIENEEILTNDKDIADTFNKYFCNRVKQISNHPNISPQIKKPIFAEYSALSKEFESSHKAPKFKIGDRVRIT